jgi:hypothetical protein
MPRAKPQDIARFHAEYDTQKDHRLRLFGALAEVLKPASVLYPGSYVDIAPSVFFDEVRYVDSDKRAPRFFEQQALRQLIAEKRKQLARPQGGSFSFEHRDYRTPLSIADRSVELLISLYAGFVSEHCTQYLAPEGHLLVNDSHGDASMASLDPDMELVGVVLEEGVGYQVSTEGLEDYLVPKRGPGPSRASLHQEGRGPSYTQKPFAYLFQKGPG